VLLICFTSPNPGLKTIVQFALSCKLKAKEIKSKNTRAKPIVSINIRATYWIQSLADALSVVIYEAQWDFNHISFIIFIKWATIWDSDSFIDWFYINNIIKNPRKFPLNSLCRFRFTLRQIIGRLASQKQNAIFISLKKLL